MNVRVALRVGRAESGFLQGGLLGFQYMVTDVIQRQKLAAKDAAHPSHERMRPRARVRVRVRMC